MKKKIKKERPYPDKTLIKGALRRLMARSPVIRKVKETAVHPSIRGPRGGKTYICADCNKTFPGKDIAIDHIKPVVPLTKDLNSMSYDDIVKRIFCPISNLQPLCKACHKVKTSDERKKRTVYKRRNKK